MQGENRPFYQEEEYEISLMDLFWYILRQWRVILIAMIVLGVLLGGWFGFKEYLNYSNKEQVEKAKESFEIATAAYEFDKAQLENKLERLQKDLEQQKLFEDNCLMLQIDPYNVYIHTASYYINTDYEIAPELYYQNPDYTGVITNSYKSAVDRMDFDTIIATSDQPLLTVANPTTTGKRMVTTSTDAGNGILNITVFSDTQERADALFSAIDETLKAQEVILNNVIGEHTLGILSEKSYVDVDGDFSTLQDSFTNKTVTINNGIEKTNEELKNLAQPVDTTPTIKSVVKKVIKLGIIGAAVGLILTAGYFLIRVLFKDIVISSAALENRYSLPVLGVLQKSNKKPSKLDLYCEKQLGIRYNASIDDQTRFIMSNLLIFLKKRPDVQKIILIGSVKQDLLQELQERLQKQISHRQIVAAGNILENSNAVDALEEDSIVIDVETWSRSGHGDIQKVLRMVRASGNDQAGFVLVR